MPNTWRLNQTDEVVDERLTQAIITAQRKHFLELIYHEDTRSVTKVITQFG